MLAVQYLEDSPTLAHLDQGQVVGKLRSAAERLPITHLLIGWHVPMPILEACRTEAERWGMHLLLWQPLLASSHTLHPDPAWEVVGMTGSRLPGYRNLPEFTFACPNHPAVREAILGHLEKQIHQGIYEGFFLDRIRFPSPAMNPIEELACFCVHCQRAAAKRGIDLGQVKSIVMSNLRTKSGRTAIVRGLLTRKADPGLADLDQSVAEFLAFRSASIADFISPIVSLLREAHLEIGLDCYSPSLAPMVGQDLPVLSACADWVKIMTYAHTYAPAGLPFEFAGLVRFLSATNHIPQAQALRMISQFTALPLPARLDALVKLGLTPSALGQEVQFGLSICPGPILAGIELVAMDGVTRLNKAQIISDLTTLAQTGSSGLALSWDLMHIPVEWLDLVRQVYFGPTGV